MGGLYCFTMVYNSYTREAFCGHLHYLLPVPAWDVLDGMRGSEQAQHSVYHPFNGPGSQTTGLSTPHATGFEGGLVDLGRTWRNNAVVKYLISLYGYYPHGGTGTQFSGQTKLFCLYLIFPPTRVNPLLWRCWGLEPMTPGYLGCARWDEGLSASPTQCLSPFQWSWKPNYRSLHTPCHRI